MLTPLIIDLGMRDYAEVLKLQQEYVERKKDVILVCEHPEIITIGRAKDAELDILDKEIETLFVERGGKSTLHLPGQVVVYPILNLKKIKCDQVQFLRLLEKSIINTLTDFRLDSVVSPGQTGVWIEGVRKIASLGIAVKNEMSFHGLSLNVTCDLKKFNHLKPCGFEGRVMTSLKNEIKDYYWKTWQLSDESLLKRVRLRLPENIMEIINENIF